MNTLQRIIIVTGTVILVLLVFIIPKTYKTTEMASHYNPLLKETISRPQIETRYDVKRVSLEAFTVIVITAGLVLVAKSDNDG